MINYRKQIFETNSSSVHSVCFVNENRDILNIPIKNNVMDIELRYYDGGPEKLITPYEKLQYFLSGIVAKNYFNLTFEDKNRAEALKKLSMHIENYCKDKNAYAYIDDDCVELLDIFNYIHERQKGDYNILLYCNESTFGIDHQSQWCLLDKYGFWNYDDIILNPDVYINIDHD